MSSPSTPKTPTELRENGYTVKFSHLRRYELPSGIVEYGPRHEHPALVPSSKGGITVCTIKHDDVVIVRTTACCSLKDNYCKSLGRQIAFGRALNFLTGEQDRRNGAFLGGLR